MNPDLAKTSPQHLYELGFFEALRPILLELITGKARAKMDRTPKGEWLLI